MKLQCFCLLMELVRLEYFLDQEKVFVYYICEGRWIVRICKQFKIEIIKVKIIKRLNVLIINSFKKMKQKWLISVWIKFNFIFYQGNKN